MKNFICNQSNYVQYLQSIYSIEHTNNDLQDLAKLNPENQIQDSSKVPPLDFPLDINSQNSQGIGINSARTQKLQAYRERLRSRQNKNELTMDIAIQSCRNLNTIRQLYFKGKNFICRICLIFKTINVMDSFRRGSTSYNIQRSIYQRNQNSPYGSQDNESPIQKSKLPLFNQQLNTENSRSKTPNLTSQKFSQNRLSFDNLIDGINNGQSIRTFNVGENDANNQMKWTQSRIKSKIFTNNNKSQDFTINPVDSQGYDKFGLNIQDQNHIDPTKEFKHDSLFKRRQILNQSQAFEDNFRREHENLNRHTIQAKVLGLSQESPFRDKFSKQVIQKSPESSLIIKKILPHKLSLIEKSQEIYQFDAQIKRNLECSQDQIDIKQDREGISQKQMIKSRIQKMVIENPEKAQQIFDYLQQIKQNKQK